MITGSLNIEKLVAAQGPGLLHWNVWWQPLAALLFFTAALAETNRLPFDLPECEQELVGGFHTEYSGIKFVLFFLAEYTHMVTISFLTVLLFFGGWHFPGLTGPVDASIVGYLLRWFVLLAKVACVVALIIQLRWTLPRFRFDQLMGLAWRGLIPLGLLNAAAVIVVISFASSDAALEVARWILTPLSLIFLVAAAALNAKSVTERSRALAADAKSRTPVASSY
jgi:NADH-quinone oxidoreductase subunit H